MRSIFFSFFLITFAGVPIASQSAELPFYASVGVSLSQTNGVADTDVSSFAFFVGDPDDLQLFPDEFPLNGQAFDDDDTGWSAAFGYQFTDYFALELGYEDLGSFRGIAPIFGAPGALPSPATIDASGVSFAAQFGFPLSERLRATWHVGLVRAAFDAGGSVPVSLFSPLPGSPPPSVVFVPFADPDDETGYGFGFGLSWAFNKHFEAELAYSRQDLQVLEFDTFGLRLIGRL